MQHANENESGKNEEASRREDRNDEDAEDGRGNVGFCSDTNSTPSPASAAAAASFAAALEDDKAVIDYSTASSRTEQVRESDTATATTTRVEFEGEAQSREDHCSSAASLACAAKDDQKDDLARTGENQTDESCTNEETERTSTERAESSSSTALYPPSQQSGATAVQSANHTGHTESISTDLSVTSGTATSNSNSSSTSSSRHTHQSESIIPTKTTLQRQRNESLALLRRSVPTTTTSRFGSGATIDDLGAANSSTGHINGDGDNDNHTDALSMVVGAIRIENHAFPRAADAIANDDVAAVATAREDATSLLDDDAVDHENSHPTSLPVSAYLVETPNTNTASPTISNESATTSTNPASSMMNEQLRNDSATGTTHAIDVDGGRHHPDRPPPQRQPQQHTPRAKRRPDNGSTRSRRISYIVAMGLLLTLVLGGILTGVCFGTGSWCRGSQSRANQNDTSNSNRRVIATTEELYQAVDAWYAKRNLAASSVPSSIGTWNVSRISNFTRVFDPSRINDWNVNLSAASNPMAAATFAFTDDLSDWDMSSATTLHAMFAFSNFDGTISSWNVSAVTDMSNLFYGASQFAGDISQWNVGRVQSMARMCYKAESFDCDLSAWDVSKVQDMQHMMDGAHRFSSNVSLWNVGQVRNMSSMFAHASQFNHSLCEWGFRLPINVTVTQAFEDSGCPVMADPAWPAGPFCHACPMNNATVAFETTEELYAAVDAYLASTSSTSSSSSGSGRLRFGDVVRKYGYPMGSWDVSRLSDFSRVFDPDRTLGLPYETDRETSTTPMSTFNEDLSDWDVSSATTMFGMFAFASQFEGKGLAHWNTSRVRDMSDTFAECHVFAGNLSTWDVGRVETVERMFYHNYQFNSDLSAWNVGSVRNMNDFMLHAERFTSDLLRWNVSSVENMKGAFYLAKLLTSDLSAWDVSRVTDLSFMFKFAFSMDSDLSRWNVSRVKNLNEMFRSTSLSSLSRLDDWDVSNVEGMTSMFANADKFSSDLSRWNVSKVKRMDNMFKEATVFSSDLSQWDVSQVQSTEAMFLVATRFASDVSSWNVSNVVTMRQMFKGAVMFYSDLSRWDVRKVDSIAEMFTGAVSFNHSLCAWAPRLPVTVDLTDAFTYSGCTSALDEAVLPNGPFCTVCPSSA